MQITQKNHDKSKNIEAHKNMWDCGQALRKSHLLIEKDDRESSTIAFAICSQTYSDEMRRLSVHIVLSHFKIESIWIILQREVKEALVLVKNSLQAKKKIDSQRLFYAW